MVCNDHVPFDSFPRCSGESRQLDHRRSESIGGSAMRMVPQWRSALTIPSAPIDVVTIGRPWARAPSTLPFTPALQQRRNAEVHRVKQGTEVFHITENLHIRLVAKRFRRIFASN